MSQKSGEDGGGHFGGARAATKEMTFVRIEIFVGGLWFF